MHPTIHPGQYETGLYEIFRTAAGGESGVKYKNPTTYRIFILYVVGFLSCSDSFLIYQARALNNRFYV